MKTKKLFIIGVKPANVPEDWLIFNAPRPLLGDIEWQGDFRHGLFYVAIDPKGYIPESWIKRNCDLDGWLVEYISEDEAIQKTKDYYHKAYPKQTEAIKNLRKLDLLTSFHQKFNTKDEIEITIKED